MSQTLTSPSSSRWSPAPTCHWCSHCLRGHLQTRHIPATQLSWAEKVTIPHLWSRSNNRLIFITIGFTHKLPLLSCANISVKVSLYIVLACDILYWLIFATVGYRWMITPEMLQQTPGVWYIEAQLLNSTWEPGLRLNITSFTSKCLFWDVKKETWSTDGCQVTISPGESLWLHCSAVMLN